MQDYYKILGVSRTSTQDEIKKAYKKLAFQFHPDKNQDNAEAEEKFKEISEAYENVGDSGKRSAYDSKMAWGMDFNRWGHAFGTSEAASGFSKAARPEPPKGSDIIEEINVTLEEIAIGSEKVVKISRMGGCSVCDGVGAKTTKTCSLCNGHGVVRKVQKVSMFANAITTESCPNCWGSGVEVDSPCMSCNSTGLIKEEKNIKIAVPIGFHDGESLRVSGMGNCGPKGGRSGDLYIKIRQIPHKIFKRDGKNLFCSTALSSIDLILGVNKKINTLFDTVEFKVPEGTQPNSKFKIKDKGINGGALFVEIQCQIPTGLTYEQKKHYEELKILEKEFEFDIE